MERKLSNKDKRILLEWGEEEKELQQIERAINKTTYTFIDLETGIEKKINAEQARKMLGTKEYLSGLSRSAFHWISSRDLDKNGKKLISFDSSKLFED